MTLQSERAEAVVGRRAGFVDGDQSVGPRPDPSGCMISMDVLWLG